jgi:hypothetical protein
VKKTHKLVMTWPLSSSVAAYKVYAGLKLELVLELGEKALVR